MSECSGSANCGKTGCKRCEAARTAKLKSFAPRIDPNPYSRCSVCHGKAPYTVKFPVCEVFHGGFENGSESVEVFLCGDCLFEASDKILDAKIANVQ